MKKNSIIIIICVIILGAIILGVSSLLTENEGAKIMTYDMDASDSEHYNKGELVKIKDLQFTYNGYELKFDGDLKNYHLDLEINKIDFKSLESRYTFMLAKDDTLLRDTNCVYKNDKIIVAEIKKIVEENPNQIAIIDNKTFEILVTINI